MKNNMIRVPALVIGLLLVLTQAARSQKIGIFDGHGDVGTEVKPGDAKFDPKTQQYEVSGAGYNIWGDHDEFHFLWKKVKGDFIVYARGEFVGKEPTNHRKFGWMARKTLDGNASHVNTVVHGDGLTSLQFRRWPGGKTEEIRSQLKGADVIQAEQVVGVVVRVEHRVGDRDVLPDHLDSEFRAGIDEQVPGGEPEHDGRPGALIPRVRGPADAAVAPDHRHADRCPRP